MNKKELKKEEISEQEDGYSLDLESDFNIKEEDFLNIKETNEKANLKKLKYNIKDLDKAIEKIESGVLEMIYIADDIMDKYESGVVFSDESNRSIKKMFILIEIISKIEKELQELKDERDSIDS